MQFAAIDIGSNAIRLLISNVFENKDNTVFKKYSLTRIPIRLGEDAFLTGKISEAKAERVVKAMKAFTYLIDIHQPLDYLAYATSAMRNAENGEELVARIKDETGIDIRIIDGQREAEIIYSTHIADDMHDKKSYLYIEVGGGSTEVSLFSKKKNIFSRSFPIGTVRILHDLLGKKDWRNLKEWIKVHTKDFDDLTAIGTGGNINTILKLMGKKEGKPISVKKITKLRDHIESYSIDDRIRVLGLRPDRADVIIPASEIYLSIMKWTKIKNIIVPKIGLADGIIHELFETHRSKRD